MLQKLHKNAKTNYLIRREIQSSKSSVTELARKFNISWLTVKKWQTRKSVEDKSSRPDKTRTSLLKEQKAERQIKKFRKYAIGYLHIDVLYAPKINGKRWYIFTCIDRVSKIAFLWVTDHKTKEMGAVFLEKVLKFYPYPIHYILTDNGLEFCYKALARKTKKTHPFVAICKREKIKHRTIKFRHPWTNGMVERFNGKVKKNVIRRYIFENDLDLKGKLIDYLNRYNFEVKLKQLGFKTPSVYLKEIKNLSIQRIVT